MPTDCKVLLIAYYHYDARRSVIICPWLFYDPSMTF